jgi:hypothetical protein
MRGPPRGEPVVQPHAAGLNRLGQSSTVGCVLVGEGGSVRRIEVYRWQHHRDPVAKKRKTGRYSTTLVTNSPITVRRPSE